VTNPSATETGVGTGGNATAAGVQFQAHVAASIVAALLAGHSLDRRLQIGGVRAKVIRLETEAPVDDILVETDNGGFLFLQAKTTTALASTLDSPLGKTVLQFVRQYLACARGEGRQGWDRPLSKDKDRLVLATGTGASKTVTQDLASALDAQRAAATAPLPADQQKALSTFQELLSRAYESIEGSPPDEATLQSIARLVVILSYDFKGADRQSAVSRLRECISSADLAEAAFDALAEECERLMKARLGSDAAGFRIALSTAGIPLLAPTEYRGDVEALLKYSDRVRETLEGFEETTIDGESIRIDRDCTQAVVEAARYESLLIVGEPGAGKSAVISAAAAELRKNSENVLELAVDRLPVSSLDGLRGELGLSHALADVLRNWPGDSPAYLFIDALDATRGSGSEQVFRALIELVVQIPGGRWRVIASIRTFDLRMGEKFRGLFRGSPPVSSYADTAFKDVRHLKISAWSDEEFERILHQAPALGNALASAGDRLKDLARVPFNTRLLADLLSAGVKPADFGAAKSQVELLDIYWRHRVETHGQAAELCIKAAISEMIALKRLRANRLSVAEANPKALDELLHENVLVTVAGERFVSFRHHILFDYAASKVAINLYDVAASAAMFGKDKNLGLLLGPAIAFGLQELWDESTEDREEFWAAVAELVGNPSIDPIVRSVTARNASELPREAGDFDGLVKGLASQAIKPKATVALAHIIGALSVRIEDNQAVNFEPWPALAEGMSEHVADVAWTLRSLLFITAERQELVARKGNLGVAARRLLRHALTTSGASPLVAAAIGFVGDTFSSDVDASRELLRAIFSPERFSDHAFEELPWLARKVEIIAQSDPGFVIEIYKKAFAGDITDESATTMGNSRILPLSSNRRQDYRHALWTLKESFSAFLRDHPLEGVTALVEVVDGFQAREHPRDPRMRIYEFVVHGRAGALQEDWSYMWASDPDDAHVEDALGIVQIFTQRVGEASLDEAEELVKALVTQAKKGLLWSRLFMAGARRADELAPILWAYANENAFLISRDTRKDAIDFIASAYPSQDERSRSEFERQAQLIQFPESSEPEKTRDIFLRQLFGTIGRNELVTDEARSFAVEGEEGSAANERPFRFEMSMGSGDDWWWLSRDGVDVKSAANAELLDRVKEIRANLQLEAGASGAPLQPEDAKHIVSFDEAIRAAEDGETDPKVIYYATGILAEAVDKVAGLNAGELRKHSDIVTCLIGYVKRLAAHANPEPDEEVEKRFEDSASWGSPATRIDAAEAAMNLSRVDAATFDALRATIEALMVDAHPGVRHSIAIRLTTLWDTRRAVMWELAARIAGDEKNRGVVSFFASYFLGRVVHHAPAKVEELTLVLLKRFGDPADPANHKMLEQLGSIVALLWVSHGSEGAKNILMKWLASPDANEIPLHHAIHTIRDALILGYDSGKPRDIEIRRRAHALASWTVEATTTKLESHFAKYKLQSAVSEKDKEDATLAAKLLNNVMDQLYFASGAFERRSQDRAMLANDEQKRAFLNDVAPMLTRIGDIATPGTVHHLIELLDFLMPADPARVFDLTAHALLISGKEQGYQFESLGVDRVVAMVGRFLADHRDIFNDETRREKLLACLELFMEAGWPAARRLVYRLPELLQ